MKISPSAIAASGHIVISFLYTECHSIAERYFECSASHRLRCQPQKALVPAPRSFSPPLKLEDEYGQAMTLGNDAAKNARGTEVDRVERMRRIGR